MIIHPDDWDRLRSLVREATVRGRLPPDKERELREILASKSKEAWGMDWPALKRFGRQVIGLEALLNPRRRGSP